MLIGGARPPLAPALPDQYVVLVKIMIKGRLILGHGNDCM